MRYTHYSRDIILATAASIILITASYAVFGWSDPSSGPPESSISVPLDTGSVDQTKTGALKVKSLTTDEGANVTGEIHATGDICTDISGGKCLSESAGIQSSLNAQDGTPENAVYVDNEGYVGIGTGEPKEKLDVAGSVKAAAFIGDGSQLTGVSGVLADGPVTTAHLAASAVTSEKISDGAIDDVKVGSISGTKITPDFGTQNIITTGNVGIGTTTPDSKLDVRRGNIRLEAGYGLIGDPATGSGLFIRGKRQVVGGSVIISSAGVAPNFTDTTRITVGGGVAAGSSYVNFVEPIQVDATGNSYILGNVGIGTTSPGGTFEVKSGNPGYRTVINKGTIYPNAAGSWNYFLNSSTLSIGWSNGGVIKTAAGGGGKLTIDPDGTADVIMQPGGGNVGIGTTAPKSALHVPDGKYLQAEDNNAGAPPSADCDSDTERGRISLDTVNFRLYVCAGAARGWDFAELNN